MQAITRWLFALAPAALLTSSICAQQTLPDGTGGPLNSANATVPGHPSTLANPTPASTAISIFCAAMASPTPNRPLSPSA
jgi:hypothetical protein